jgi:hypothetical protein
MSPEFKGRGERHALLGGIGAHEMIAGRMTAGELRWLVEKLVLGGKNNSVSSGQPHSRLLRIRTSTRFRRS